ncbi:MAG TPA: putative LPS assembly protein LptD [Vicinamibacterales bacterium]
MRKPLWLIASMLVAASAFAQPPAPPAGQAPLQDVLADWREYWNDQNDQYYFGSVELKRGDVQIFADEAWFYRNEDLFVASGNVVFKQGRNQIASEYAEFNTKTNLGTFYNAAGIAVIQPPRQAPQPGAISIPQMAGQENVVYFFGDEIEKVGPKKYRITNGGFTTCVQPTPRWDLTADTITLNVDAYTFLRNAVLTAKGVPLLYLPVLYYPTKHGERATGFLLPTIGTSSLRGMSLHDAFFWAINRSQDATLFHDFFSKVGQGYGTEYRYNYGAGADGDLRAYFLDQHSADYVQNDGSVTSEAGSRSFELRGGANQALPLNMRGRAYVNYFSSITTAQTFNTNPYDVSRNQRSFGGNVVGAWHAYSMNATVDRNETFYNLTDSSLYGTGPRVNVSRNESPLLGSQLYFSLTGTYANLIRGTHSVTSDGVTSVATDTDLGYSRFDIQPQIRYPFKQWGWLTANSTISWRDTYFSRSAVLDDATGNPRGDALADAAVNRRYYTLMTQIVGPVFNRIWDTPNNGYAEKFKHSVEPYLTIQRTSTIDNFKEIPLDGADYPVPGTQYTYGINNRFYAKRRLTPGQPGQAREIFDVELSQSYYDNPLASQYDAHYVNALSTTKPTNFSPIALSVRAMPSTDVSATVRAEFDARYHAMRTISANGSYSWTGRVTTTLGWTKYGYIPELEGTAFSDPTRLYHMLNAATNIHTRNNHFGVVYNFGRDFTQGYFNQQQLSGYYNAQCCGLAFQYQQYNFPAGNALFPIPSDHRFFLTFTLAGLGNFSPFNGALGNVPR